MRPSQVEVRGDKNSMFDSSPEKRKREIRPLLWVDQRETGAHTYFNDGEKLLQVSLDVLSDEESLCISFEAPGGEVGGDHHDNLGAAFYASSQERVRKGCIAFHDEHIGKSGERTPGFVCRQYLGEDQYGRTLQQGF